MQFRVWYKKPESEGYVNEFTVKRLVDTHVVFDKIEASDPEEVFFRMQGEVFSPNGEARYWVERLGLDHTSMSVGDVVENCATGEFKMVMPVGFAPVPVE